MLVLTRRSHRRVCAQLDALTALCRDDRVTRRVASVSGWSVGQQLEHLAKSDEKILKGLETILEPGVPPMDTVGGPSLICRVILVAGHIPRGRGKAPETVIPDGATVSADELRLRFESVGGGFREMEPTLELIDASTNTVPHPLFGPLRPRQWLRFVAIHNRHHMKIINDILAAA